MATSRRARLPRLLLLGLAAALLAVAPGTTAAPVDPMDVFKRLKHLRSSAPSPVFVAHNIRHLPLFIRWDLFEQNQISKVETADSGTELRFHSRERDGTPFTWDGPRAITLPAFDRLATELNERIGSWTLTEEDPWTKTLVPENPNVLPADALDDDELAEVLNERTGSLTLTEINPSPVPKPPNEGDTFEDMLVDVMRMLEHKQVSVVTLRRYKIEFHDLDLAKMAFRLDFEEESNTREWFQKLVARIKSNPHIENAVLSPDAVFLPVVFEGLVNVVRARSPIVVQLCRWPSAPLEACVEVQFANDFDASCAMMGFHIAFYVADAAKRDAPGGLGFLSAREHWDTLVGSEESKGSSSRGGNSQIDAPRNLL